MDTNWCLFCGQHTDNELPYCSRLCQSRDNLDLDDDAQSKIIPILPVEHHKPSTSRFTGRDVDGISAWAAQIPAPNPKLSPPPIEEYEAHPYNSSFNVSSSSLRPPKLLLPHRKALPPSLSLSMPRPSAPTPSVPIEALQQPMCDFLRDHPTMFAGDSATSLLTDSIATPRSAIVYANRKLSRSPASLITQLATQVRSWVTLSSKPSHPKLPSPQPAIVGVDDHPFLVHSKSRPCLSVDEMVTFHAPIAKFQWHSGSEQESEFEDDEYTEDESSFLVVPPDSDLKSATTTPTPQFCTFPASCDSSSSILDVLAEELHPAFRSRGRQLARRLS